MNEVTPKTDYVLATFDHDISPSELQLAAACKVCTPLAHSLINNVSNDIFI